MQYGYCLGINFLRGDAKAQATFDAVAEAGFDYVELPLFALWEMKPGEMTKLKEALSAIPCKACNIFFPGGLTIVGPQKDWDKVHEYLEKMLPLASELGAETLVFGNGNARKIPQGESREAIWNDLRQVAETMDIYAKRAGVTILAEPLNSGETNIINTYSEAVALTQDLTNVSAMIDSYHVAAEGQNYDDVYKYPEALRHLHTAYPLGRTVPSPEDNMALYADFAKMVKTLGYDSKISVEGALRTTEPQDIKAEITACLDLLKGMFE